jgi:hypothetical protein
MRRGGLLLGMAAATALPGTAQAADAPAAITCVSATGQLDAHRLSEAGFTRIHARVKVTAVMGASPSMVIQQQSPAGDRLNFMVIAGAPPPPGMVGLPLFSVFIEHANKDTTRISASDKTTFFSSEFDLTLTRDAAGKARIEVRWDMAKGSSTTSAVFDSAGFPAGPVTLFCAHGGFALSGLEIE